ncbi:MAG: response regulator [Clostridiales bacterium]|nr:response regulator [Clostridiales bacterium]
MPQDHHMTPEELTGIIRSLGSTYSSLYYIDLGSGSYQELTATAAVHERIGASGAAQERLNYFCHHMMSPEHTDELLAFVDLSTLDARMADASCLTKYYHSIILPTGRYDNADSWRECAFIACGRSDGGHLSHVLFATYPLRDTRAPVLESYQSLIQALAIPYDSIYAVNMDTGVSISYRMAEVINGRYGKQFGAGSFELNLSTYIEHEVLPQDRPLFDSIRTVARIGQLLKDKTTYAFVYRVLRNGKIQYFQCQLVLPDTARQEFVIAFKNVDEEKKLELAQQHRLEQALSAVEKSNELLLREMELANALTKDYPDVMLADLEHDSALTLKLHGHMIAEEERGARRPYTATWLQYIDKHVLPEDREAMTSAVAVETVQRALEDKDEYACSYRILCEDRTVHYYQAVFIRVHSRSVRKSIIIFGFRNVDGIVEGERRHMQIQEEQLRIIDALSREYHSLFKVDSRTGAIALYRTDGIGMDSAMLRGLLSNGSYEDVLGKYIEHFIVPEDQQRIRESSRLSVLMEKVPEVGLYKQGYRRNINGVLTYYEMNVVKTIDETGAVIFILGMRDVDEETKRQLTQSRKIETQDEIIQGLAAVYYSVLLVDPDTDRVTVYRAQSADGQAIADHFRSHDYRWSEGLRSYAEAMVSQGSREGFLQKLSLQHIRCGGEDYSLTYEKLTDSGIIYLQSRVSFVHDKDGRLAVVVGTRNVDDLIKRERQQEMALQEAYNAAEAANRAKTDFLSSMSHDIRTPMNGIIGMTAIAAAHIDDKERVQDCLQKITQASKHLLSLINEVLDMSKIESGKVSLMEEEFNLSDLIDNLLTMTSPQIEEHHHQLSVNITDVTHEAVIGDSLRIQQVFTNLMGNAIKYTPDGGHIKLTITEKPSRQTKVGCYEFVFEDNGIGMTQTFLDQIFEPFARAENNWVHHVQGTGLGMPISRNIVRMMGGDIKVKSEPGVGSRFTVTIYLKLQDTIEVHYDQFIDLDVLVADDDPMSMESCCSMLSDLGMKAKGVSTGAQAVHEVVAHHQQKQDYFACIVDWKMPDMDGIATTRAIRRAVGRDVPIIIISAYDWSDIEQEARAAGVDAFISKPLFRSRLARTFSALVGAEEPKASETSLSGLDSLDLKGRRALLVEDNALNAEIAGELMGMTGLEMEYALDGIEAVDRLVECPDGYYDIIFMDIQMPRMNGYDATRAIRAMRRSYCKQVPIIAMTANAFAEDVQAAKTVGMNEHIAKPLDLNVLARALRKWLL